ncbi:MAG TPA: hypothetical protein VL793_14210 [Patescibacteria group bacterium]|nr:hypothetical protein [Patescibacteria group bacterium]
MKIIKNLPRTILLTCVAAGAIGVLAPTLTLADGKGASKLMFTSSPQVQAQSGSAKATSMSCARCTDGYTKVADTSAKGMRTQSTRMVAVHMCPSCTTSINSVGSGKAKADKVSHSCGSGSSCCVASK